MLLQSSPFWMHFVRFLKSSNFKSFTASSRLSFCLPAVRDPNVEVEVFGTLGLVTRYYFLSEGCCLKFTVLFLRGALSDDRTFLLFAVQSLNGPSSTESVTLLQCIIWDSPNPDGQVPVFISTRNRAAQLHPRALGSLYVASYHSQGYGGGILTRLRTGSILMVSIYGFLLLAFP
jgi:hypothetical protein